jgi:hypothetical protein
VCGAPTEPVCVSALEPGAVADAEWGWCLSEIAHPEKDSDTTAMSGLQHILDIQGRRRRLDADCEFFVEGNYERFTSFRITSLAGGEMEVPDDQPTRECITCNEIGCQQKFYSLRKYAEHKFQCHQHQCSVCGKSFLSDRQLSIHISELHDSYFAAMAQRSPSFECLVEGCTVLSWSDAARRKHLLGDHKFHPSFDFHNPKRHQQQYQKAKQRAHAHTLGQPKDSPETSENTPQSSMQIEKIEQIEHIEQVKQVGQVGRTVEEAIGNSPGPLTNMNRSSRRAAKQQSYREAHGDEEASVGGDSQVESVGAGGSSSSLQRRTRVEGKTPRVTSDADPVASVCIPLDQTMDQMDVEDADLADLTSRFSSASINIPLKISFGRRKGNR